MTPIKLVLSKLPDAKRNGAGWQARCPAHDDRNPSLSVTEGDDGRVLLNCHAGCHIDAVLSELGLTPAHLFPLSNEIKPTTNKPTTKPPKAFPSADDAVAAYEQTLGKRSTHWTYHDAASEPVGLVLRWSKADGKKIIRPVGRTPAGWIMGKMAEPWPLYRLPDLLQRSGERVYVAEGEKAADAARTVGLLTTTSPHGSKSAAKADWQPLAGRDVVILPDNDDDEAGLRYAETVARILTELDPPAMVRIVELPGLPDGGDFVEYLQARDGMTPESIRAEVEALADAAKTVKPENKPQPGPILTCLADVEPKEVQWLWPGRVPQGRITLLVGRPGEGKSFFTTDAAARVSTGRPWPDGADCPCGSVIFVCAEDDPGDTIRPRLDAHDANVQRVHLLSAVRHVDENGEPYEVMFTLEDVASLERALITCTDCRLVVIDPIGSFLGGKTNAHRDNEVRAVLAPVARLAEKYGPAVLVVAHRRKGSGIYADDLALGSRAFTGIARAVWHLTRDEEDATRRLLLPGKNNLGPEGTGLAFRITGEPAAIEWEPDPVGMSADDALAIENGVSARSDDQDTAVGEAVAWLQDQLAYGSKAAKDIKQRANRDGIAPRTLDRAKKQLGVEARPDGYRGPWVWHLPYRPSNPQSTPYIPENAIHETLAYSAPDGALCDDDDDRDRGEV